jgi:hypothetical protein
MGKAFSVANADFKKSLHPLVHFRAINPGNCPPVEGGIPPWAD